MLKHNRLFFPLFLLLVATIVFCCSGHPPVHSIQNQAQPSTEKCTKSTNSTIISKTISDTPLAFSCNRQDQTNSDFLIRFTSKLLQTFKLLFCFLLLSLLFKGTSKETFIIYLTRVQYFIADLNICILSSRAHPPTR
jgi:hypothetical protein